MKIDIRVLLIALQLGLVALVSAQVTVEGGWFDGTLWDGLLLGFNLGAAIFGAMLYKQGQLLDEVLCSWHKLTDMILDIIKTAEAMESKGVRVVVKKVDKKEKVKTSGSDGSKKATH